MTFQAMTATTKDDATSEWVQVYDLERDHEYIERLQMASVEASEFALSREYGLIGSASWWQAIGAEKISPSELTGRIARVYINSANWPEFELESDGERSTWALEGEATRYRIGKHARIRCVMLPYANPAPGGDSEAQIVTGIWIED